MRRRGLIAGAAAVAVGLFAHPSTQVAAGTDGDIALNTTSPSTATTTLSASGANPAFKVFSGGVFGVGILVQTSGYAGTIDPTADGVQGFTVGAANSGILGRNDDLNAVGVYGIASNGTGVAGQTSGGSAISGNSTGGAGGYFISGSGNGLFASSGTGFGIVANSANNPAVYGAATNSIGVQGIGNGAQPYGVVGSTTTQGGFGLLGQASADGSVAFSGTSYNPKALAGQFVGSVTHYGTITLQTQIQPPPAGTNNAFVVGPGVTKNAAVLHADGTHRLFHCVEAPEPWFEDFGEATITGGKAEIKIDPDFAAAVDMKKVHVFLTETGGHSGMHVTSKTANSFHVAASPTLAKATGLDVKTVTSTFSYRIVAKRNDVSGERLAKFTFPTRIDVKEVKTPAPQLPTGPTRHADGISSLKKK